MRVRAENDVRARVNGRVPSVPQCGAKIRMSAPASLSFWIPVVMLLLLRPVHPGQ